MPAERNPDSDLNRAPNRFSRSALSLVAVRGRAALADSAAIANLLSNHLFSHNSLLLSPMRPQIPLMISLCNLWMICAPKFNLILQLNSLFASDAFPNLFRQRQRIFSQRVLTFGNNEICMHRRNHSASASLCPSFPSHRSSCRCRQVLAGGFLKKQPADRAPCGWVAIRRLFASSMRALIFRDRPAAAATWRPAAILRPQMKCDDSSIEYCFPEFQPPVPREPLAQSQLLFRSRVRRLRHSSKARRRPCREFRRVPRFRTSPARATSMHSRGNE